VTCLRYGRLNFGDAAIMTAQLLLLILFSVGLSALAQMFLKLGVGAARIAPDGGVAAALSAYAFSPYVIFGLGLYGLGAVAWLFVLSRLPLTAAYPFVGLGFVMTMIIGITALGENVSPMRLFGTLMIAAGCVLVARSV
jgi:multidrug transporter EmrE-like cation transporter